MLDAFTPPEKIPLPCLWDEWHLSRKPSHVSRTHLEGEEEVGGARFRCD